MVLTLKDGTIKPMKIHLAGASNICTKRCNCIYVKAQYVDAHRNARKKYKHIMHGIAYKMT